MAQLSPLELDGLRWRKLIAIVKIDKVKISFLVNKYLKENACIIGKEDMVYVCAESFNEAIDKINK